MNFGTVVSTGWRAGIDCKRAGWGSGQGRGDLAPIKSVKTDGSCKPTVG